MGGTHASPVPAALSPHPPLTTLRPPATVQTPSARLCCSVLTMCCGIALAIAPPADIAHRLIHRLHPDFDGVPGDSVCAAASLPCYQHLHLRTSARAVCVKAASPQHTAAYHHALRLPPHPLPRSSHKVSPLGVTLALLSCAFAGLRWTLIQLLLRSVDGADATLSRASSPLGSIACNRRPILIRETNS